MLTTDCRFTGQNQSYFVLCNFWEIFLFERKLKPFWETGLCLTAENLELQAHLAEIRTFPKTSLHYVSLHRQMTKAKNNKACLCIENTNNKKNNNTINNNRSIIFCYRLCLVAFSSSTVGITHLGHRDIVAVGDFRIEFFDVCKAGNDPCGWALRLLAVKHQFRWRRRRRRISVMSVGSSPIPIEHIRMGTISWI